jgi:putative hydrolase of the HAD superfamily
VWGLLHGFGYDVPLERIKADLVRCEELVRTKYSRPYTLERIIETLYERLGWPPKREEILCLTDAYAGPRYRSWLFPGTEETLKTIHECGILMGLIANTAWPGYSMDRAYRGVGLIDYLRVRVYSGDEGISKPNVEIFRIAERRSRMEGKKLLYVGNNLKTDIEGAKNAGWAAALKRSSTATSGGLADFEFDETPELLNFLE